MNYKTYQNSRDAVWDVLIREHIIELPIKVGPLCKSMGILVNLYQSNDDNSGHSMIVNGRARILVKQDEPIARQRFTIAHELGHIILGHVGEYKLVNREPSTADNPIEQAANVFASRLLAPACVMWGCGVRTADDIMLLCDISRQAAEFRMQRMNELYRRNKFLLSPLEQKVYKQFSEYIHSHKL